MFKGILKAIIISIIITSFVGEGESFAKERRLSILIDGRLKKIEFYDSMTPWTEMAIETEDGQLYFLTGKLVNRLRELFEEVEGLKEHDMTIRGLIHRTKIQYKKEEHPLVVVLDYFLPKIEGIDLDEEEIVKLEIKGEALSTPQN